MNDEMDEGNLTQMDVDHDKDNEQEVVINEDQKIAARAIRIGFKASNTTLNQN